MEERSNNKDRITKTGDFLRGTTEKLRNGKDINRKGKRSHEEVVWQEKTKFSRVETRESSVVKDQKYPIKMTFKEAGPKNIWTIWNYKKYWIRSVSAKITRRIGNIQYVQWRSTDMMQKTPI